jgi:multicomponent Na+:H+ antiporter subunit D
MFSALVFAVFVRSRAYLPNLRSVNLDVDWLWRRFGAGLLEVALIVWKSAVTSVSNVLSANFNWALGLITRHRLPGGLLLRSWPTGSMSLWVMLMLFGYLLLYYVGV